MGPFVGPESPEADCTPVFSGTKRGKLLERLKAYYLQQEDVDDNTRRARQRSVAVLDAVLSRRSVMGPRTRDMTSTSWYGRRTTPCALSVRAARPYLREDQATGFCKGVGSRRRRHEDVAALRDCAKQDGAVGKTAKRFLDFHQRQQAGKDWLLTLCQV